MPWNQVNPMDQRLLFLADYLRQIDSVTALSFRYGISRKTAYKWIKRYRAEGILETRFSRPHTTPTKTPYALVREIIRLRSQLLTKPGPKKLQALLAKQFPNTPVPSKTTIYNILKREGLIDPAKPRRRPVPPGARPFGAVDQPNDLWTVDYKGQFRLGNGKSCYPLTIMDHDSRFLFSCKALSGTLLKDTKALFKQLFKAHGLPLRIRSDNGTPFASRSCAGLSRLSIWWIKLGIHPERIDPGKPQQNGQHERMHRTLKQSACKPPSHTMAEQQERFEAFRTEYNEVRPHEALEQQTPSERYRGSPRAFPDKLQELQYPDYYTVLKVQHNGVAHWGAERIYISHLLKNEHVALNQVSDGVWCIYFGPVPLGTFSEQDQSRKTKGYFTLNV